MTSILNNIAALNASRQIGFSSKGIDQAIERMTSGKRINRASDDAAGLALSNGLNADIRVTAQGRRNAAVGVSYLEAADGVLDEVTNLLFRAGELVARATSVPVGAAGYAALDLEFQGIITQIADIGLNTKFNGQTVFDSGTALTVAVASFSPIGVTVSSIATSATAALGLTGGVDTLGSLAAAQATAPLVTAALDQLGAIRAQIGATQNQLTNITNALDIQVENYTAVQSQIRDANVADEMIQLTKFQILNQAGTAALSQANTAQQSILQLLR